MATGGKRALPARPTRHRGPNVSASFGRSASTGVPNVSAAAPHGRLMTKAEFEIMDRKRREAERLPHFKMEGEESEPVTIRR
jgi:hypothetical protein